MENAGAYRRGGKCRSGKYRSDIVWKAIRRKYSKVRDEILANSWTSIAYNHRQCVRCQQSYRGLAIRRTKKRVNLTNDKRIKMCFQRFDTRLQFLRAVSHAVGSEKMLSESHSDADDDDDTEALDDDTQHQNDDAWASSMRWMTTPVTTSVRQRSY